MRKTFLLMVAAMLCSLAAPAHAHEEHRSNLDVVLDRVSPQPAHLEVRIVDTLAPQMLVTNRTGQTLEIVDRTQHPGYPNRPRSHLGERVRTRVLLGASDERSSDHDGRIEGTRDG